MSIDWQRSAKGVSVQWSPREYQKVQQCAAQAGVSIRQFVKQLVDQEVNRHGGISERKQQ